MSYTAMGLAMEVSGLRPLHKLVLLSVANRADNETNELWPSYEAFRADTGMDRKSVWQALKALKEAGLIEDTGKRKGITGQVQVLRLRVDRLRSADKGKEFQKRNDSENGTVPFFPSNSSENGTGNSSENGTGNQEVEPVNEPVKKEAQKCAPLPPVEKKRARPQIELSTFIAECKETGEAAIPENDPINAYAETVGISDEMLFVCWQVFKARHIEAKKRQKDWRAHFRKAVRSNWYKLWYMAEGGAAAWTTAGQQERKFHAASN